MHLAQSVATMRWTSVVITTLFQSAALYLLLTGRAALAVITAVWGSKIPYMA